MVRLHDLRDDVAKSRLRPEADPQDARIYRAIRQVIDKGSVYYVLSHIPEQREDVFKILVDDETVVGFELERGNPEAVPKEVERYSMSDFRRTVGGGLAGKKLRIALELARGDLNELKR